MDTNITILIADDDSSLTKTLSDILSGKGYLPVGASTGREAIERARDEIPVVALIDLILQDMSGLEVVKKIKGFSPLTECIVITGHASQASAVEAINLGAYGYIQKPYDVEQLLVTIKRAIEKREAEEALRESEGLYQAVVEQASEGIFLLDPVTRKILDTNKAFRNILGYTPKEMIRLNVYDFLAHEKEDVDSKMQRAVKEKYHFMGERKYRHKDGSFRDVEASASLISHGGKEVLCVVVRDITERKRTEIALQESEEKYRNILENIEEGYYEVDLAGNFIFFNDAMCRIRGYSREELMGMNNREYMDPVTAKKVFEAYSRVYTTGRAIKGYEWETIRKDGTKGHVEVSAALMKNPEGKPIGFRGIVRDVSERKLAEQEKRRLEDQLHQAQKMEAMGLLAGGVAHDLNNILSGIVSYPDLLLLRLPKDSPLRKPIKTMQESGMRAADVVEDLLTIARGVATGKEVLNLNTTVKEYLDSIEHMKIETVRPSITFKTELAPDLFNISGSPTHVNKALMNLIVNASEAIDGSGTVTISTMNQYLDEPIKGYEDVRTGEYAALCVSNDGHGILPGDLERIFEPFYTKKAMGRSGTGLGLAVVWNTVHDHHGYINVGSNKQGTVFELYFPVTREKESAEKMTVILENYLGSGEKILVVDDEEQQREIACGFLSELNYHVEAVSSGEEAIEYIREQPVDLIVLDMVMPKGINGRETYERIIKIQPGQKAVIASGFSETEDVKIAQSLGAGKYVKKPYVIEKIGLAVKEELG